MKLKNFKLFSMILIVVILISTTLSQPTPTPTSKYTSDINYNVRYYTMKSDVRKCAFPMCGGYFLKELNSNNKEVYVSTLVQNGSLQVNEDQFKFIQNYQIIVYGIVSNNGSGSSSEFNGKITVSKIYRYLDNLKNDYNLQKGNSFKFYNIIDVRKYDDDQSNLSIDNGNETKIIHKLNTNLNYELGNLIDDYNDNVPLIQMDWLNFKIMSSDALFTSSSTMHDRGNATIDHIFIGLPDPRFCPRNLMVINCKNNTIATYTRSTNRCESFSGCVTRGPCPLYIPVCSKGYKLTSIPNKPHGCPKYYCDPDFL